MQSIIDVIRCPLCFLSDAIIEKTSIALAKYVMKISPPVPRRKGWEDTDDETGIFYIKFKTSNGRDEVTKGATQNDVTLWLL